jgi:predicted dehydrogenase
MNSEAQSKQHFVVFGSGSAGRRHARALRSLFPNARIQMVKRSSSVQPMHMLDGENIEIVHDVDAALTMHPDMVVVASPATLHAGDVLATLPYCQKILIEKPLAQNLTDADLLLEALQKFSGSILVGYHLRFSETPRKLLELCSDGSLGEMLSASFGYGQHLSLWRKEIDARNSVTARADLGGGVLLELSHEIDAIDMLVGQLSSVKRAHITADALIADGIVDTAIDAELITVSGVDVTLHLDMTSTVPWRSWQIRFAKGSLNANLLTGEIFRVDHGGVERLVFKASDDERDSAARSQISSFMSVNHSYSNLKQSHFVMMIIDAIRRSADAKESVVIVPRYGSM